jgi:hypothetical protein
MTSSKHNTALLFRCFPFTVRHSIIQPFKDSRIFSIIIKFPFLAAFRYLAYSANGNNKNCLPVYAKGQGKYELPVLIDAH